MQITAELLQDSENEVETKDAAVQTGILTFIYKYN